MSLLIFLTTGEDEVYWRERHRMKFLGADERSYSNPDEEYSSDLDDDDD